MKVSARVGLFVLAMTLGACGFQSSAPNKDYFSIEAVQKMDCSSVDKTELQSTLDFNPNTKQASEILKLNPGMTSLDPLREALRGKLNECNGVPKQEIKGSGNPAPWSCPEHAKQNFDPNKDGNFASNGVENTNDILALSGRDARALAFYAHRSNLAATSDPNPLLIPDNTCLSQAGQDTWNQLKGALTASTTKVNLDAQAPGDWYNTGMVNGQPVVDTHAGIGGDRSAIEYMFSDGTKLIVLKRCSNLALPSQGDLPRAVTNHQRPPGTTVTPPSTTKPPCPNCPAGKDPNRISGNGGEGDGGTILYPGGDGTKKHTASPTPEPPKAGNPQPTQQPAPNKPPANPVPSGTPAPSTPQQPPDPGAQPSTSASAPCVNPPGSNQCGG